MKKTILLFSIVILLIICSCSFTKNQKFEDVGDIEDYEQKFEMKTMKDSKIKNEEISRKVLQNEFKEIENDSKILKNDDNENLHKIKKSEEIENPDDDKTNNKNEETLISEDKELKMKLKLNKNENENQPIHATEDYNYNTLSQELDEDEKLLKEVLSKKQKKIILNKIKKTEKIEKYEFISAPKIESVNEEELMKEEEKIQKLLKKPKKTEKQIKTLTMFTEDENLLESKNKKSEVSHELKKLDEKPHKPVKSEKIIKKKKKSHKKKLINEEIPDETPKVLNFEEEQVLKTKKIKEALSKDSQEKKQQIEIEDEKESIEKNHKKIIENEKKVKEGEKILEKEVKIIIPPTPKEASTLEQESKKIEEKEQKQNKDNKKNNEKFPSLEEVLQVPDLKEEKKIEFIYSDKAHQKNEEKVLEQDKQREKIIKFKIADLKSKEDNEEQKKVKEQEKETLSLDDKPTKMKIPIPKNTKTLSKTEKKFDLKPEEGEEEKQIPQNQGNKNFLTYFNFNVKK